MRFGSVIAAERERREEEAHDERSRSFARRDADDELLDLGRPLVDAERANLAVEPLDDARRDDAEPAVELHGAVDDALRGLGREHLGHRDGDVGARVLVLAAWSFSQAARETRRRAASSSVAMSASAACVSWKSARRLPNCTRALTRASVSSSARRAMPHAAAPTEVRKTSSVPSASRSPCPTSPMRCVVRDAAPVHHEAAERVIVARRDRLEREPGRAPASTRNALMPRLPGGRRIGVGEDDEVVRRCRRSR